MLTVISVLIVVFITIVLVWKMKSTVKLRSLGKAVLITGCDSGIGLAMAIAAHRLGFHVIATCLNDFSTGAKILKDKCFIIKMDITKSEDIQIAKNKVISQLESSQTTLWAVVNNAGVLIYGHFDWQLESQILLQAQVNFVGTLLVTKAFLPLIRRSKGRIVNITSANGHWCLPGLSVYCGTKHAIEGFSNALRAEMIPWNVKVILVNPGNHPGSTGILSGQVQHAEVMKRNFTLEEAELYGDYFERFHQHLQTSFPSSSHQTPLQDEGLNKIVENALLLENPHHYYQNISIMFRLFMAFTKILPTYYGDRFLLRMWGSQVDYKLI